MARVHRFPREARLKRRRLIRPLFDRSRRDVHTVARGCLRLLFRVASPDEVGQAVPVQVGFAPGRTPNAVTRNRIRRHMREVYRVHQHHLVDLFSGRDEILTVMILYRGRPDAAADCIPADLPRLLRQVAERLAQGRR